MKSFKLRVMAQVLPFLLIAPALAPAQTPPSRSEAMAAMKAGQHNAGTPYTRQQIDQLIAPIALYPDQLLAQALMAATYPKQLLEAADWLQDPTHAALKGDALAQALADLKWDPSVKALVAFPPIIAMMTEHIEWTESLGLAFATQQAQVMSRVQALRQLALKSGHVKNVKHVTVRKQGDVIEIVSAEPDRVFVPVYNPTVVYGSWPDPHYPPIYVAPPRRFASETRETTVETVEPGIQVFSYPVVQPLWGWTRPDWRNDRITIETDEYTRITRGVQPPPDRSWRREGPIVIVAPSSAPHAASTAAVPAGTVAPAQAAAVGTLKERATSRPDRVRVETSTAASPTAAPPSSAEAPSRPGTPQGTAPNAGNTNAGQAAGAGMPGEAQGNRQASEKGQPTGGATPAAGTGAQTGMAQAQQPQSEKAQAQHPQAEKAQAQQPQLEKPQTQQPQAEKAQAQHPQAEKAQAQQPQAEKSQAQQPQAEKAQAQHPQPEKAQAQHPQAEKAQAQQPQAAAKPQTEKAPTQSHGSANTAAPGGAAQNHANPAAGRATGAAGEAHGQGSSAPPKPAALQPGHEAAAAHHAPGPHPSANQKEADKNEH